MNRTCDPWFTRQAVYPLHHRHSPNQICINRITKLPAFHYNFNCVHLHSFFCWKWLILKWLILKHEIEDFFILSKFAGYLLNIHNNSFHCLSLAILILFPSICMSVHLSVVLSPPKPLDEIQPNLVCELFTWIGPATTLFFCPAPWGPG